MGHRQAKSSNDGNRAWTITAREINPVKHVGRENDSSPHLRYALNYSEGPLTLPFD